MASAMPSSWMQIASTRRSSSADVGDQPVIAARSRNRAAASPVGVADKPGTAKTRS